MARETHLIPGGGVGKRVPTTRFWAKNPENDEKSTFLARETHLMAKAASGKGFLRWWSTKIVKNLQNLQNFGQNLVEKNRHFAKFRKNLVQKIHAQFLNI